MPFSKFSFLFCKNGVVQTRNDNYNIFNSISKTEITIMNPITGENYEETKFQSKLLANRMRSIFYLTQMELALAA
jgi:hypothetical protein